MKRNSATLSSLQILLVALIVINDLIERTDGKHRTRIRYRKGGDPSASDTSSHDDDTNADIPEVGSKKRKPTASEELINNVLQRGKHNYDLIDRKHSYFENEMDRRQERKRSRSGGVSRVDNGHHQNKDPHWKRTTNIRYGRGKSGNEKSIQIHSITQ